MSTKLSRVGFVLLLLSIAGALTMINFKIQSLAADMQVLAEFAAKVCILK